jgi:uncharacterized protein (DUF697 family)
MLFKILKLFGLDVPAKIDAVKASLELRLDQATHHVKEVVQEAAVIAALSVIAAITSAMTVAVGLIALYRWTADAYGVYDADQFRQAAIGKRVVLPAQKRDLLVAVAEKP